MSIYAVMFVVFRGLSLKSLLKIPVILMKTDKYLTAHYVFFLVQISNDSEQQRSSDLLELYPAPLFLQITNKMFKAFERIFPMGIYVCVHISIWMLRRVDEKYG